MKKLFCKVVVATMMITSMNATVFANTTAPVNVGVATEAPELKADVIVNYYRVKNGQLQMRQWNETRGYWVDEWTDIGTPAG